MSDFRAVVVCEWICTPKHLLIVADSIVVMVACAAPTTDPDQINRIPITVAIALRDVCAAAFVNGAKPVADAADVKRSNAAVYLVADTVGISVDITIAITIVQATGVKVLGESANVVVSELCEGVVVASQLIGASDNEARLEVARTVIDIRIGIEVAGCWVRAPFNGHDECSCPTK